MGVASGKIVSRVPCPPFSQTLPTPLGVRRGSVWEYVQAVCGSWAVSSYSRGITSYGGAIYNQLQLGYKPGGTITSYSGVTVGP